MATRKCPYCAEQIDAESTVCPECGSELNVVPLQGKEHETPLPKSIDGIPVILARDASTLAAGQVAREKTTRKCPFCAEEVGVEAMVCPECGSLLDKQVSLAKDPPQARHGTPVFGQQLITDYAGLARMLQEKPAVAIESNSLRRVMWFVLANTAVILTLSVVTAGAVLTLWPLLFILSCIFPFIAVLSAKSLAIRAHRVRLIRADSGNANERQLVALVHTLCRRAGLEKLPEIGVYPSPDMNAFATGATPSSALIAFSQALLDKMDERGVAAIAAHEIAHIRNGDMVTLALVQSVVNALAMLVTIPLSVVKALAFLSDKVDWLFYLLISAIHFLVSTVLMFLGSLVVLAFSRRREFAADECSARLLDADAMIHALEVLLTDPGVSPKEQQAYAALKVHRVGAVADFLSTHPSIQRRIESLRRLAQNPDVAAQTTSNTG